MNRVSSSGSEGQRTANRVGASCPYVPHHVWVRDAIKDHEADVHWDAVHDHSVGMPTDVRIRLEERHSVTSQGEAVGGR